MSPFHPSFSLCLLTTQWVFSSHLHTTSTRKMNAFERMAYHGPAQGPTTRKKKNSIPVRFRWPCFDRVCKIISIVFHLRLVVRFLWFSFGFRFVSCTAIAWVHKWMMVILLKKKLLFVLFLLLICLNFSIVYSYGAYLKYVTVVVRVASKTNRQKTCLAI